MENAQTPAEGKKSVNKPDSTPASTAPKTASARPSRPKATAVKPASRTTPANGPKAKAKPTAKPGAKPAPPAAKPGATPATARAAGEKGTAKPPAARKPAARKPAARKPAARKTAAPKPVAPKPAAPKTAAPDTAAPDTAAPKTVTPKAAAPTTEVLEQVDAKSVDSKPVAESVAPRSSDADTATDATADAVVATSDGATTADSVTLAENVDTDLVSAPKSAFAAFAADAAGAADAADETDVTEATARDAENADSPESAAISKPDAVLAGLARLRALASQFAPAAEVAPTRDATSAAEKTTEPAESRARVASSPLSDESARATTESVGEAERESRRDGAAGEAPLAEDSAKQGINADADADADADTNAGEGADTDAAADASDSEQAELDASLPVVSVPEADDSQEAGVDADNATEAAAEATIKPETEPEAAITTEEATETDAEPAPAPESTSKLDAEPESTPEPKLAPETAVASESTALADVAIGHGLEPASEDVVLQVRGLSKGFGDTVAVDDITLTVRAGVFYGIVGPNGAGKTTTLSMITGLLRPDSGTAAVNGVDVWTSPETAKRSIGVLPDRLRIFDRLTGSQLLYYSGVLRGLDATEVRKRSADLATAFGLDDVMGRLVSDYSSGMLKKVALAAAMIHSPRLLVLDEPFESVDPVSAATVTRILKQYVDAGGTVLLSSHRMELVQRVCSHVAVIVEGKLLADGTIDDVRDGKSLEDRFVQLTGKNSHGGGLEWLSSFSD